MRRHCGGTLAAEWDSGAGAANGLRCPLAARVRAGNPLDATPIGALGAAPTTSSMSIASSSMSIASSSMSIASSSSAWVGGATPIGALGATPIGWRTFGCVVFCRFFGDFAGAGPRPPLKIKRYFLKISFPNLLLTETCLPVFGFTIFEYICVIL